MDPKKLLEKHVKTGRIHHAYLIAGKYADKLSVAYWFAELLKCHEADILKLIKEEGIGIGEIKIFKHDIMLAPFSSPWKLAIIYPVDGMTTEAQNSLLKVLEEPPPKSVIMLLAENEDRVLPTIASRCHRIILTANEEGILKSEDKLPAEILAGEWNVHKRFEYAKKVSERKDIEAVLDGWLIQLRREVLQEPDSISYIHLVDSVQEAKKMLHSNASSRLILENLMLSFVDKEDK